LLLRPFLSEPAAVRVDCEYIPTNARVWVRMSSSDADRERLTSEGNRHLYAVRAILSAAAREAGQTVYLDFYGINAPVAGASSDRPRHNSSKIARPLRRTES
jgi:uncharacterized protein